MRVVGINETRFGANPLKINAKDNQGVKNLTRKIMEATSVYGQYRSGSVVYRLGKESGIEITDPAKGLPEFLKQLGIKFGN